MISRQSFKRSIGCSSLPYGFKNAIGRSDDAIAGVGKLNIFCTVGFIFYPLHEGYELAYYTDYGKFSGGGIRSINQQNRATAISKIGRAI